MSLGLSPSYPLFPHTQIHSQLFFVVIIPAASALRQRTLCYRIWLTRARFQCLSLALSLFCRKARDGGLNGAAVWDAPTSGSWHETFKQKAESPLLSAAHPKGRGCTDGDNQDCCTVSLAKLNTSFLTVPLTVKSVYCCTLPQLLL